ncbi:MAG: FliA/WhiG family RNA polymerase sigma factor [Firmicutes bacterium]|nr:FliA/WhiG family RNA polymerase sigma factor [Bacillota bacterium]MDD4264711.1 FliA/WhiG family RNA polymerase sigma factor [Bacillota bacterium]MDD4693965.1 FliA/WhiG family RNA polymerase sigma factor [Bacillota bacterium]
MLSQDKLAESAFKNTYNREELIKKYMYLVKEMARTFAKTLPSHIELDELESLGYLGLVDAVDKFDSGRGVPFEAYGKLRIKGAILDGLRRDDWLSEGARRKAKVIASVYDELEIKLQRPATDEEMAERLGTSVLQFRKIIHDVYKEIVSLEAPVYIDNEGQTQVVLDILPAKEDISSDLEKKRAKELIVEALNKLPEKEKIVLALHYYEGLNLTEIAEVLELSTSRISQLHGKAILRMRGRLGRRKAELF